VPKWLTVAASISTAVEAYIIWVLKCTKLRRNHTMDFLAIEICFESYHNHLLASKVDSPVLAWALRGQETHIAKY